MTVGGAGMTGCGWAWVIEACRNHRGVGHVNRVDGRPGRRADGGLKRGLEDFVDAVEGADFC